MNVRNAACLSRGLSGNIWRAGFAGLRRLSAISFHQTNWRRNYNITIHLYTITYIGNDCVEYGRSEDNSDDDNNIMFDANRTSSPRALIRVIFIIIIYRLRFHVGTNRRRRHYTFLR